MDTTTQVSEEQVRRALAGVTDFDRGGDVVSLGMISGIAVEGDRVAFSLEVPADEALTKEPLRAACEAAVRALPGVGSVSAVLTAHRPAPEVGAGDGGGEAGPAPAAGGTRETVERVIEALHTVYDPEIPVDIYELGLIYDIDVRADGEICIEMTLTAPGCPVAGIMPGEVERAVLGHVPEASSVMVNLVWDPPWTMDRMSEAARLELGFF